MLCPDKGKQNYTYKNPDITKQNRLILPAKQQSDVSLYAIKNLNCKIYKKNKIYRFMTINLKKAGYMRNSTKLEMLSLVLAGV